MKLFRMVALIAVVSMVAAGAVAVAQSDEIPSPEEARQAMLEVANRAKYQIDVPDDWDGPTSSSASEDGAQAATVVEVIGSATDGCGDPAGGADIDDVEVGLEDDGDWRFTVNFCAAYDINGESGWQILLATTGYDDNSGIPLPVTTYVANLTHGLVGIFSPEFEPNAVVNYNDGAGFLSSGRPDKDTLRCGANLFSSGDRGYIGPIGAATGFFIDLDPTCFGDVGGLWFSINSDNDDLLMSEDNLAANGFIQEGRASGGDRFETAAELSRRAFPRGGSYGLGIFGAMLSPATYGQFGATAVVYLTNGLNFPDALGASAFQASGMPTYQGPILYMNGNNGTVPDATLGEICRIQPGNVVALGGTLAVPQSALDAATTAAEASDCTVYGLP